MMSKIMRQQSHSSSISNSTSSQKPRLSFFKKRSTARDDVGSDRIFDTLPSARIPSSPFSLGELELTRSNNALRSVDSFSGASDDLDFLLLHDSVRRIRKAPSGPEPKNVDAVWEVYKKLREECLELCKRLLQKSQTNGRNEILESSIDPLDKRLSLSGSITESSSQFQVNDQWLSAVHDYKATQESMLDNLRTSLLTTYKAYEPDAPERQLEAFLEDKVLRKNLIIKWRDTSVHRMKSEKLLFWEKYKIRSLNYDKLKHDLSVTESLFDMANPAETPNLAVLEYVIANNGDTILEFAKAASELQPILRFRVSSHLLAVASSLFAKIMSPSQLATNPSPLLQSTAELPPPPSRHICKDGMEVKVYHMPQIEHNHHEALTILLHAAHMHHSNVPREIDFPAFVSIAEVCLRYRCTSPLELQVEYQWLPQWIHMIGDESPDGFLLISYTFGLRRIFTRLSKTAILNSADESEIERKELWPQAVRDKIKAIRRAKLAQIQECCTNAIEEYVRPSCEVADRRSPVGSLALTSVPRCPKGSHLCDATNLGWLMLVYNELGVLPAVMKSVSFDELPTSPRHSLKELVDCLKLMPSAPQVHSGVCDYAPAFRSAINDIYNSISGTTLRDVSGLNGWALSKHADAADDLEETREVHQFPSYRKETKESVAMSDEAISLRILSHLDNLDDLNAAAMIDKGIYSVYKINEASLLKNVMKAERRRTMLKLEGDPDATGRDVPAPNSTGRSRGGDEPSLPVSDQISSSPAGAVDPSDDDLYDDLYDDPPEFSRISQDEVPMSAEEANLILWPKDDSGNNTEADAYRGPVANGQPVERNDKCLLGDVAHIEDKARVGEDGKYLRDEKDKALGTGIHKHVLPPS